jgi:HK97 family phage portal protein
MRMSRLGNAINSARNALGVPGLYARSVGDTSWIDGLHGGQLLPALRAAQRSAAGVRIDADSAMRSSTVWACVSLIADSIATQPVGAFYSNNGVPATQAPPMWLHHPHFALSRIDVLTQALVSLLLHGNAYFSTARTPTGAVVELTPLNPAFVTPFNRVGANGAIERAYRVPTTAGSTVWTNQQILHIPGLMRPADIVGISPVAYAKDVIGLDLAAREYGARLFAGDGLPGMAIEVPGTLPPGGAEVMKEAYHDAHSGPENAHRLSILTEGAKFSKITMNPEESQFLETRKFQVADIARLYRVPAHLAGDVEKTTTWGTGLAELNAAFTEYCLSSWVERIEIALTALLQSEPPLNPRAVDSRGWRTDYIKFNMDAFQRGAYNERMVGYSQALGNGILTINEVRAFERMGPVPGTDGDVFRVPNTVLPVDWVPPPPPTPNLGHPPVNTDPPTDPPGLPKGVPNA